MSLSCRVFGQAEHAYYTAVEELRNQEQEKLMGQHYYDMRTTLLGLQDSFWGGKALLHTETLNTEPNPQP